MQPVVVVIAEDGVSPQRVAGQLLAQQADNLHLGDITAAQLWGEQARHQPAVGGTLEEPTLSPWLVAPGRFAPKTTCVGTRGPQAGRYTGTPNPCSPLRPPHPPPRFLWAGSCCHLLATLCPPACRWGQWARDAPQGQGCTGARGTGMAQLRPHDGDRTKDHPPMPRATHWHHPALPTRDGSNITASVRG